MDVLFTLNKSAITLQLEQFTSLEEDIKSQVWILVSLAQLESKVELHMNSGCGINDGIYRVKFDDGEEMCFILPGG